MIKYSIIIPVYNGEKTLEKCLDAVFNQKKISNKIFEVILINNNSNDNTVNIAKQYKSLKIFSENKQGSYAARNKGIMESKGKFLCFIDHDVIVDELWLFNIDNFININNTCLVIQGKSNGINSNKTSQYIQKLYNDNFFADVVYDDYFCKRLDTRNCVVKKSCFDKLGYFNQTFKYWGDAEFGGRLIENGIKINYVSSVSINHVNITSLVELFNLRLKEGWYASKDFKQLGRKFTVKYFNKAVYIHMNVENPSLELNKKMQELNFLFKEYKKQNKEKYSEENYELFKKINRNLWEIGVLQDKLGLQLNLVRRINDKIYYSS